MIGEQAISGASSATPTLATAGAISSSPSHNMPTKNAPYASSCTSPSPVSPNSACSSQKATSPPGG